METPLPDTFTQYPDLIFMRRALQRCKGFGLYFARCNAPSLRTELVATLKSALTTPIIELTLQPDNDIFIDVQMAQLLENAPADAIVFIYDIEKLFNLENRDVIQELNWRRGLYGRMAHPVVFWLPEFILVELFNHASDFMDWRSGVYEFSLSQAEQQNLLSSTWQSASENFVEQLSLPEKQRWISQLQNLLAELEGEQSTTKSQLLNRLGQLYDSLGKYDNALTCFQQNLSIQQDIGEKQGEGATLNNLATTAHAKGDYDTALTYLTQSLKISQDIGDKQGEGVTLNNLSQIYKAKGDYDTALTYLTQSLKIQQDIGDKKGEGTTLNNLATTAHAKGDYDTALTYLTQSLKISQDIGDKQGEGVTLNNLSQIYKAKGDYDTALTYLTQSLKIQQDIGDKKGEGTTLNNLATTAHAKGDYDTALTYLTQSLKIQQDIGDRKGESATLFNMGHIHRQNNEQELAMKAWRQSYQIAKQIGATQALAALEKLSQQLGGKGLNFWEQLQPLQN